MGTLPKEAFEVIRVWDCQFHFVESIRPDMSVVTMSRKEFREHRAEVEKNRRHVCDKRVHGFKPFEIPKEFVSGVGGCSYVCPVRQNYYRVMLQSYPFDEATRQKMQEYVDAEPNVPENPEKTYSCIVVHPKKERGRRKAQQQNALEAAIEELRAQGGSCGELIGTEDQMARALSRMDWDEIKEHVHQVSERLFETMDAAPKVHGFMMYRCEDCGQMFRVYLEQGIEEDVPGRKACPFMIKCPHCETGLAQDMYCTVFPLGYYRPLVTGGTFYFANVEGADCGKFRIVGKDDAPEV